MKALLGIVGGLVLTLAVFASGLAFATWLLTGYFATIPGDRRLRTLD